MTSRSNEGSRCNHTVHSMPFKDGNVWVRLCRVCNQRQCRIPNFNWTACNKTHKGEDIGTRQHIDNIRRKVPGLP